MTVMTWADRLRALYRGNNFLSPASYNELADHIESLATDVHTLKNSEALEVVRLATELANATKERDRLRQVVAEVESLTKDTDGGDVDGDAEIPIGEIRRVLAESVAR